MNRVKRYRVLVSQTIVESAWIVVEADNESNAAALAEGLAVDLDLNWKYDETRDREAIHIEEESTS